MVAEFDTAGDGNPDNFFLVTSANSLLTLLSQAFESILQQRGSFSSASLSSGVLSTGTKIYQAIFNTENWSGQLLAYALDSTNGDVLFNGSGPNGSLWDAGIILTNQNFDTGRRILTYKSSSGVGIPFRWPSDPTSPTSTELDVAQSTYLNTSPTTGLDDGLGSQRLNFIRGDRANEEQNGGNFRDRETVLGDIINSTPIVVSIPGQQYPEVWEENDPENNVSYDSFRQANLNRQAVLYVGANDGTLHAFNADTGSELLAYVPSKVYENLPILTSPSYTHHYYVDGPPTIIDVFINGQWRTILSGGLNGGGQAIYTLDVTTPSTFSENTAASIVKWEFTDSNDADLGYTFSQPSIVRLHNGDWAAIFGNGFNNTVADGNPSTTGNAVIYIVNIDTGVLIKKFDTGVGMADDPLSLARPNGMASPAVVDMDGDSVADRIYAGDLFGNVWKIDTSDADVNNWGFSFVSGGFPVPLFVAQDSNGNRQPITTRPAVSRMDGNPSGVQLYVGTGKYIEPSDKIDTSVQSMYALRDESTTVISGRAQLREQTILQEENGVRVTSDNLLANNDRGWYLDLIVNNTPRGERIVSNPLYNNNKIIFSTIIPTDDPCDFGGESWLMELNAFTGTRLNYNVFDINGDGAFDSGDQVSYTDGGGDTVSVTASGIASEVGLIPTPSILNAGDIEYKYLSGTSGGIQKVGENPGINRYGRQSWKQLKQLK